MLKKEINCFFCLYMCSSLLFITAQKFWEDHYNLPIVVNYTGSDGGYIGCYCNCPNVGLNELGEGFYSRGLVRLQGEYSNEIFQPIGYFGEDISKPSFFKDICNEAFPDCLEEDGCWAGGDTYLAMENEIEERKKCVTLFERYDQEGNSYSTCENGNIPVEWNDKVSSIIVASGFTVELFQNFNYSGSNFVISDTWEAPKEWNDKLSSLKIYIKEGIYKIGTKSSQKYLDIADGSKIEDALVQVLDAVESRHQKFYLKHVEDNIYNIININSYMALSLSDPETDDIGVRQKIYNKDATTQKWKIVRTYSSFFTIQSLSNNKMLGVCNEEADVCLSDNVASSDEQEFNFEQAPLLSSKRFNELAYLTTHNSFSNHESGFVVANQAESLANQLKSGVRGIMLDIYYKEPPIQVPEAGVYLYHGDDARQYIPGIGTSVNPWIVLRLYGSLQTVVDFLNENPNQIITIFLEDHVEQDSLNQLEKEFEKVAGLQDLLFDLDNDILLSVKEKKQWPLISDMIHTNKRLIIFSDNKSYNTDSKTIAVSYDQLYTKQNYWSLGDLGKDFDCSSRWNYGVYPEDEEFRVLPPLFLMSHFRNVPFELSAKADNIFENIWIRINRQCKEATGQLPNFLAVDFFSMPDNEPMDVVKKLNNPSFPMPTRGTGCWKESYGRGSGKLISTCEADQEKSGLLCYPYCDYGYTGVGPVCWQDCPDGFRDDGALCAKPEPYGRGAGYVLWEESDCNNDHSQGCEKYGLMWYPKCDPGFYAFGCCICSPECQDGQTDIGVSCAKKSYGRGAGYPMICASDLEQDLALCYPYCKAGYEGVGPMCWQGCPDDYTDCGAVCVKNQDCGGAVISGLITPIAIVDRDETGLIWPTCNTG